MIPALVAFIAVTSPLQKLRQYQEAFAGAYAQALSVPASDIQILGISCDGVSMLTHSADNRGAAASRSLLAATATQQFGPQAAAADSVLAALLGQGAGAQPQQQQAARDSQSEVVTRFSVTAPSEPSLLSSITNKVTAWAPNILAVPLAQFYHASVQIQPAGQLEGWQKVTPAVPTPGGIHAGAAVIPAAAIPSAARVDAPTAAQVPAQQQQVQPQGQSSDTAAISSATAQPAAAAPAQAATVAAPGPTVAQVPVQEPAPQAGPVPAAAAAASSKEELDPEEEPEEPVVKQPAKTADPATATTPAPKAAPAAKKSSATKSNPNVESDDYYPIDNDDAAVSNNPDGYEGLDPDEMPIEPPPPAVKSNSRKGAGESDEATPAVTTGNADGTQWVEFYDTAPTCAGAPTITNSVYDGSGRLWGWEKKAMCVFRATSPQWAPVTWREAKACSGNPTASNSVYDESGKLWGWQDNSNCAFKVEGKASKPAQLTWKSAPSCIGQPSSSNSVTDLNSKKWGWSAGKTCAFRQVG